MRIDNGHICKHCIYFTEDNGDDKTYCCLDPLYEEVKPYQTACKFYSDDDEYDEEIVLHRINRLNINDEDDDYLSDAAY